MVEFVEVAGLTGDGLSEDLDLAGFPRVRDGKVDLGCYECWLNPRGMFMSIK